jgi:hypothetical protein
MNTLHASSILFALMMYFGTSTVGVPQGTVLLKGSVTTLHNTNESIHIELIMDGRSERIPVKVNGNFKFHVPEGTSVSMRSSCIGCITKDVVIDTEHIRDGKSNDPHRTVKFDIVLESQNSGGPLYHPGPVGSIAFAEGTGRLMVHYDKTLTHVGDAQLMVINP